MAWWLVTTAPSTVGVVSSASRPANFADGPFATRAQAQAQANADAKLGIKVSSAAPGVPSGPGPNGRYSYAQLEGLWINAGGSRSMAPLMAAIAEAESGGNLNETGGVGEKGLWQVNPHAWGSLATYDAAGNARAAVHILAVQGLTAWSTYTNGAYKGFLSNSTTPNLNVGSPSGGGSGNGSGGTGGTSGGNVLTSTINPGTCVIPINIPIAGQFCLLSKGQARGVLGVLLMIGGGLLLLPGLLVLAAAGLEKTGAGAAASKAASVVPAGRIAN